MFKCLNQQLSGNRTGHTHTQTDTAFYSLGYYRIDVILVGLDPAGLLVDLPVIHVQTAVISAAQNLPEDRVFMTMSLNVMMTPCLLSLLNLTLNTQNWPGSPGTSCRL